MIPYQSLSLIREGQSDGRTGSFGGLRDSYDHVICESETKELATNA